MRQAPVTLKPNDVASILAGRQSQLRVPRYADAGAARARWRSTFRVLPAPGDLLWARERFVFYRAERKPALMGIGYGGVGEAARPSYLAGRVCKVFHREPEAMARCDSRLTLEVLWMRLETVAEIAADDALANGMAEFEPGRFAPYAATGVLGFTDSPKAAFAEWWRKNYPSWPDASTAVVAIGFVARQKNIDALLAEREAARTGAAP